MQNVSTKIDSALLFIKFEHPIDKGYQYYVYIYL